MYMEYKVGRKRMLAFFYGSEKEVSVRKFKKLAIRISLYMNLAAAVWFNLFQVKIFAAVNKVNSFQDLVNQTGGNSAGGFSTKLTKLTNLMNDGYVIIRSVVIILAMCVIYLGIMKYANPKGGRDEMQGKEDIKRALKGVAVVAALGSIVTTVFNIATGITF